jgi:NitT/TauT family transport system permease protein
MSKRFEVTLPWIFMAAIMAIWEGICIGFDIPSFVLPAPSAVLISLWVDRVPLLENSLQTLFNTLAGFIIAVVLGVLLGIVIGTSRVIYRGFYPLLVGFNAIPKIAVVPVFVVWFGIGTVPAVLTAFLVSFFPITVNVATGLATIEAELLELLRSLGASKWEIVRKVGLPRSLPYFFASLKIAITLAFIGAIISETVAANRGIGYLMMAAASNFKTSLVFSGLTVVAFMGIVLYAGFAVVEQRVTFWAKRGDTLLS